MTPDPKAARETFVRNLHEKTGKTLEQWVALVRKTKLAKHGAIMTLLKAQHGLSHGYANLVALTTLKDAQGADDAADPIAAQYAGAKSALRPLYDALVAKLAKLGPDVELAPKKAYVSVRRSKQFALIQPSTATRLDVGIQLPGVAPSARLEASGSFNAMMSHRVRLSSIKDVNAELVGWLRKAYERA